MDGVASLGVVDGVTYLGVADIVVSIGVVKGVASRCVEDGAASIGVGKESPATVSCTAPSVSASRTGRQPRCRGCGRRVVSARVVDGIVRSGAMDSVACLGTAVH